MFSGFGHHDVWSGTIGIVDPKDGLNFPHGVWKVTQELPWPEVGDGPIPTPGAARPISHLRQVRRLQDAVSA